MCQILLAFLQHSFSPGVLLPPAPSFLLEALSIWPLLVQWWFCEQSFRVSTKFTRWVLPLSIISQLARAVQLDDISRLCHYALSGGGICHPDPLCLPVYSPVLGCYVFFSWCFLGDNCHFQDSVSLPNLREAVSCFKSFPVVFAMLIPNSTPCHFHFSHGI